MRQPDGSAGRPSWIPMEQVEEYYEGKNFSKADKLKEEDSLTTSFTDVKPDNEINDWNIVSQRVKNDGDASDLTPSQKEKFNMFQEFQKMIKEYIYANIVEFIKNRGSMTKKAQTHAMEEMIKKGHTTDELLMMYVTCMEFKK